MKKNRLHTLGVVVAFAVCFMLIQNGAAQDFEDTNELSEYECSEEYLSEQEPSSEPEPEPEPELEPEPEQEPDIIAPYTSGDLDDFLNEITISNHLGEVVFKSGALPDDNAVLFYGANYAFDLTFRAPVQGDIPVYLDSEDSVFIYNLPAGLYVTGSGEGEVVFSGEPETAGYYKIFGGNDPYLEIQFYDIEAINGAEFEFSIGFSADCILKNGSRAKGYGSAPAPLFAPAAFGDTWDLFNFGSSVVVRDLSGVIVSDGNFNIGESYVFSITFEERPGIGGQFGYNANNRLVYQLPNELKVSSPITNGQIFVTIPFGQRQIGSYTIDTSGRVEVWFNNVDNQGNPISQNFIDRYTNVSFALNIEAEITMPADGKIRFSTSEQITVNMLADPPGALRVNKTAAAFNGQDETVSFNIEIIAAGSTISSIILDETLSFNIQNTFTVASPLFTDSIFSDIQYRVVSSTGAELQGFTPANFAWSALSGAFRLSFPSGLALAAGDKIELGYKVDLSGILDHFGSSPQNFIQRLIYNLNLTNTAAAKGTDSSGKPVTGSAMTQTTLSKNFLTKSGSFRDAAPQAIRWTAFAGDGSRSLNGLTITDTLYQNQTAAGGIPGITVTVFGYSGGVFTPAGGYTLSAPEVSQYISSAPNGFAFHVPSDVTLGGVSDIRRVQFVYDTNRTGDFIPTDPGVSSAVFSNDISMTINGNTSTRRGSVTVNKPVVPALVPDLSGVTGTKDSKWILGSNGQPTHIEYTMEVIIPAGLENTRLWLQDMLIVTDWEDHTHGGLFSAFGYYTEMPVGEKILRVDQRNTQITSVTIDPDDEGDFAWEAFYNGATSADRYTFTISVGKKGTSSTGGAYTGYLWTYDQQKTVTVTYRVPLAGSVSYDMHPSLAHSQSLLYTFYNIQVNDHRNGGWWLVNSLQLLARDSSFNNAISKNLYYISDYVPLRKIGYASAADYGVFDYKVLLNWRPNFTYPGTGHKGYSLFEPGLSAIFEDKFDERLEYVPGSFCVVRLGDGSELYVGPYSAGGADLVDTTSIANTIRVDFSNNFMELGPDWKLGESISSKTIMGAAPSSWYAGNYRFIVYYQLRVKEEFRDYFEADPNSWEQTIIGPFLQLGNEASVYGLSDKYSGKWSQRYSLRYYPPKPVIKDMSINGRIAKVDIIVNPLGARMRPVSVESPQFTAVDKMSNTLAIYLDTVEILTQTKTANGMWDGIWIPVSVPPSGPQDVWGVSSISPQEVNFELLDERPIRILYDALITVESGSVTVSNDIFVYGESASSSKPVAIVKGAEMIALAGDRPLMLYKEDEDIAGLRLNGAEFELYLAIEGGAHFDGASSGAPLPGFSSAQFYKVCDAVPAGAAGVYKFESNWMSVYTDPANNGVYLIRETISPDGYKDPVDSPDNYTYFVLDPSRQSYWAEVLGRPYQEIKVTTDNIYITNKGDFADVVIKGIKKIEVPSSYDAGSSVTFTFELTQVDRDGTPYTGENQVIPWQLVNEGGGWFMKRALYAYAFMNPRLETTADIKTDVGVPSNGFDRIFGLKDGTYYFKVEEAGMPAGWTSFTEPLVVTVEVDSTKPGDDKVTVSHDMLVFENKYKDPMAPYANATIPVKKFIAGDTYDETKEFSFRIEEVILNGGNYVKVDNGYIAEDTITITGEREGLFIIEGMPAPDPPGRNLIKTYYFRIWEEDESGSSWIYDSSVYIVRIDVLYDNDLGWDAKVAEIIKEGSGQAPSAVTFTNLSAGARMPDVGGIGRTVFVLIGALLMGGALAAMFIRRRT